MSITNSLYCYLILIMSMTTISCWYSRCDEAGRCTISETETSEQIYLVPGYLPLFPEKQIIPIKTATGNSSPSFSIDAIHGFSLYGPLSGEVGYECANGYSECAFSCCHKGYCAETVYSCNMKRDTVDLIYIITCSLFAAFIIVYWVMYFVLGCKYNKIIAKTQKDDQRYGSVIKTPDLPNHIINEDRDEMDEPGMRSHGSIENSQEEQKEGEEDKRTKMKNVANRLAKLQNQENDNNDYNTREAPQPEIIRIDQEIRHNQPQEKIERKDEQGEISISSQKDKQKGNVDSISGDFQEVQLEDMI